MGGIPPLSGFCRNREGERIMKTLYFWETNEKNANSLFLATMEALLTAKKIALIRVWFFLQAEGRKLCAYTKRNQTGSCKPF